MVDSFLARPPLNYTECARSPYLYVKFARMWPVPLFLKNLHVTFSRFLKWPVNTRNYCMLEFLKEFCLREIGAKMDKMGPKTKVFTFSWNLFLKSVLGSCIKLVNHRYPKVQYISFYKRFCLTVCHTKLGQVELEAGL